MSLELAASTRASIRLVVAFLMSACAAAVFAVGPAPDRAWRTAETAHFRVHFEPRHRALAERVGRIAEAVHPQVTGWLNWQPRGKTELIVADYMDMANGFATPVPYNRMAVFVAPPDEGELLQNDEWLHLVLLHEYTHIVHLDKARGAPLTLRDFFGRFPLLFPNVLQPTWVMEGLATYRESVPADKVGRLRNSHFEALMRLEAERGFLSLREVNADGRGLPRNRMYLYGAYFFDFLAERYGQRAVPDFVENYSANLIPFRVHSNPVAVTGKTMDVLWDEFLAHLRQRFPKPGPAAGLGPRVAAAPDIGSIAAGPDGSLYLVRHDGITRPEMVRRHPDGRVERVDYVAGNARVEVSADGRVLVVQPEVVDEHDYFNDLYLAKPGQAALRRLTTGGRWREAVWAPSGDAAFAGLRVEADGRGAVWAIGADGRALRRLYRAEVDESLLALAADPSHGRIAWISGWRGQWRIVEAAAGAGDVARAGAEGPRGADVRIVLADASIKHSLRYDAGGRLRFVSDADGRPDAWLLDRPAEGGATMTRLTGIGTAVTGLATGGDSAWVRVLDAEGEAVYALAPIEGAAARPADAVAPPASGPASPVDAAPPKQTVLGADRAYAALPTLLPRAWIPTVSVADGATVVGAMVFGSDVLGNHQYVATPAVELSQAEPLLELSYLFDERFAVQASRRMSVVSTTGGSRKEIVAYDIDEKFEVLALLPRTRRELRLHAGLGAAVERSTRKVVDIGQVRRQDERVLGLVLAADTRHLQWRSEGPSEGVKLEWLFEKGAAGSDFPGRVHHGQVMVFLPIGRTVLAARARYGAGQDDAEPFALGGIEGAALFELPDINQRSFGLRGYDGSARVGHRMKAGTVEWRVPIADVDRHLMVPPVGLNRLSAGLFFEGGTAAEAAADAKAIRSRGVELFGELKLGYLLPLELRLGYAEALDEKRDKRAYLVMGRAF
jgi:hypothetical protein